MSGEEPIFQFPPDLHEVIPDFRVNKRIFIHDGSISEVECDVVVLSCSKSVAPRGMKAVYDIAGPELSKAARKLGPKQVRPFVHKSSKKNKYDKKRIIVIIAILSSYPLNF